MNDFSILDIKSRLTMILPYFEPSKEVYQILNNCINNDVSAEVMYTELLKVSNTAEYSDLFQNFFNSRFGELKLLVEKDREIQECLNKIKYLNDTLKLEFNKRNIEYNVEFIFNYDYLNMSYNEKKDYLYYCNKEINNLTDKLSAVNMVKTSGESFDEKMGNKYDEDSVFVENSKEEVNRIQEESSNNIREFINPSLNNVVNFINDYKEKQQDDSFLNVKVVYDNNGGVTLDIGFRGNTVNEKFPLLRCYYSNAFDFNRDIYPFLLEQHVIDGGIDNYNKEEDYLKSYNIHNESFEVSGNNESIFLASQYLGEQVVSKEQNTFEKEKAYVRVREFNNSAYVNGMVFTFVLIFAIIMAIFILLIV